MTAEDYIKKVNEKVQELFDESLNKNADIINGALIYPNQSKHG